MATSGDQAAVGVEPALAGRSDARALPRGRLQVAFGPIAFATAVYVSSRLLLVVVAAITAAVDHRTVASEMSLFDGQWYLRLAEHGYPTHLLEAKSTLGFFPLYPLVIRGLAAVAGSSLLSSALVVSFVGGLVAAVLVQRLATSWWGEGPGRWAVTLACLFPGSIVFSMAYSEGLTVPLALGCLLALSRRRWTTAGILAALATAVEPVAVVLVAVCLVAAVRELRQAGLSDRAARRSLAAPVLAPVGIGAFALFLWAWTGTPFATYVAQHRGWYEQTEPLAILAVPLVRHLAAHPSLVLPRLAQWNLWNGVAGGAFLAWSLVALGRVRRELTPGGLALPAGVAVVTVWSVMTPPNARMLLVALPAVVVWARRLSGRRRVVFAAAELALLVGASALTFSGRMLP